MADTIFVHAANLILVCRDSYLEYLKPEVKSDTWIALRNHLVQYTALFPNAEIAKAEEDIAKTEADLRSPNPVWVQAGNRLGNHFQPYCADWSRCNDGSRNRFTPGNRSITGYSHLVLTLETGPTFLVGVGVHLLQDVVPLEERTNSLNNN